MEARRLTPLEKNWLRERKAILKKVKNQVELYTGPQSEEIMLYSESYGRDLSRKWKISEISALLAQLLSSQVVFGGDFHSFAQAQRSHLRLLRALAPQKKLCLAMEVFSIEDQPWVDAFLEGALPEVDFLEKIQWEQNWGFPWNFYRPLVDFARQNKIPVLAVNHSSPDGQPLNLNRRDELTAQILKQYVEGHPGELVYVLFGDLHISQEKLPRQFDALWNRAQKPVTTTVYLNPEKIYFQLARKGLENSVEVVCFAKNQFAILSSPPWVIWQNYLMYLEGNYDVFLDDIVFEDWDDEEESQPIDFTDHVNSLVQMIVKTLGVEVETGDIEVYSPSDGKILQWVEEELEARHRYYVRFLISNDLSFYMPNEGFFYLSKSSVNHAAALAAQYVHSKISLRTQLFWNCPKFFLNLIWVEAMGFLLSKFVNPKRKAENLKSLKNKLVAFQGEESVREPLLVAMDHKMSELLVQYQGQVREKKFRPRRKASYVVAARFLGGMMGQRYFNLLSTEKITRDSIINLLSFDPCDPGIEAFYFNELHKLDKMELEAESTNESMVL